MVLCDKTLRRLMESGALRIKPPLDKDQIQCASIDLKLGNEFKIRTSTEMIDLRKPLNPDHYETLHIKDGDYFELKPNQFDLATTMEYIALPTHLGGRACGRSSVGRVAVQTENAGWIDPGFHGEITLEIKNQDIASVALYPGMRIIQSVIEPTDGVPHEPYNGKYQGQTGATASRIHLDTISDMLD